jgi:peroxiredoxin Q/BCP
MIEENTHAPDFSLQDDNGTAQSLKNYQGSWVLLYFYPKDDTLGCTTEACAFRDNFPFYEDIGITIIGISKDSAVSHKKFKEKYSLPFTLLSDTEGSIAKVYGADGLLGTKRISYLIDPEGTIKKSYAKVSPATHAEEVLNDLKTFTHI